MNFYASVVLASWLTQIAKFSFSIFVPMQQYRSRLLKKTYMRIVVSMNKTRVNMLLQRTSKIKKESIPSHFSAAFLCCSVISILNYLQRYTFLVKKKKKKNSRSPFITRLQQQRLSAKATKNFYPLPDQLKQFIISHKSSKLSPIP